MKSFKIILCSALSGLACLGRVQAGDVVQNDTWQLLPQAQVDGAGIFLDQIVVPPASIVVLPHLRLAAAPNLGQAASLSRNQIMELAQKGASELITTNWSGATQVRVSRRTRQFIDSDLNELLTATLQKEFVKDRGQLELHFTRPWVAVVVPDEPLTLKVGDLPAAGVMQNFVATCEVWCGRERVGSWQVTVQASVWRDVPVAQSSLLRGEALRDADVRLERRDVLVHRDLFLNYPTTDDTLELAEGVQAGEALMNHSIRVRPLILRGRLVEGVYKEGSLSISLKVEALEDGLLGQTVRVRNPKTQRVLYGKVENEQTVLIAL